MRGVLVRAAGQPGPDRPSELVPDMPQVAVGNSYYVVGTVELKRAEPALPVVYCPLPLRGRVHVGQRADEAASEVAPVRRVGPLRQGQPPTDEAGVQRVFPIDWLV